MLHYLPAEIGSYVAATWRRRWQAVVVAWALAGVGWAIVAILPDQYQAQATVYVDTESTLGPLLKNIAVENDLRRQMDIMQRTLLSRPNLAQVARVTDLHLTATDPAALERLYQHLFDHIQISAETLNLFRVTYVDPDAMLAKNVVQALLTIFVESNLGRNREDMQNARQFIERQIAQYENQLKVAEDKIAAFKSRNLDIFGSGAGGTAGATFGTRLESTRQAFGAARRARDEASIQRDQLAAQLAVVPQFLDVDTPMAAGPTFQDPVVARLEEMRRSLDSLRLRFTEQHPDVIATRDALTQLEAQVRREGRSAVIGGARTQRSRVSNVVYEQLKLRLVEAESNLATQERRVIEAGSDVRRLDEIAARAPAAEAEFADLNRDYGVLKRQYEELLSRRESARISQAVETTGDKVQFRVVEPPTLPAVASGPPRRIYLAVVLVMAIAAGVGFAFLLSRVDDAIDGADRLSELFRKPVLGTITRVENATQRRRERADLAGFAAASAGLVCVFLLLIAIADQLSVVARLLPAEDLRLLIDDVGG